ncbi:hypothetical protein AOQ84DRAFT_441957 [Glonium stellatum]|uniref:Uncharacterized protein n=1 Tax=Glonium stellatum TaxID=574774 RepID=A0A8E2ETQ0_9PEZI|nr:hypothetical protein AOQ84DRAFT_441957 [Glonium stellatum]
MPLSIPSTTRQTIDCRVMDKPILRSSVDGKKTNSSSSNDSVAPPIPSMTNRRSPTPPSISSPKSTLPTPTQPSSPPLAQIDSPTMATDDNEPSRLSTRHSGKRSLSAGPKDSEGHILPTNIVVDNHGIVEQPQNHYSEGSETPAKSAPPNTSSFNRKPATSRGLKRYFFSRFYRFIKEGCSKSISHIRKKYGSGGKEKARGHTKVAGSNYETSKANVHKKDASADVEPEHDSNGSNDFIRSIHLAIMHDNEEKVHIGCAQFDTGNPYNLVSREFIEKTFNVPFNRFPEGKREVLSLPNNHTFCAVGQIHGRWTPVTDSEYNAAQGGLLRFNPKFYESDFYVSEEKELFDVVIGSKTIKRENLMKLGPPLALTGFDGFRAIDPDSVKGKELEDAHNKQQMARAQNAALKERDTQRKNQSASTSQTQNTTSRNPTKGDTSQA